MYQILLVLFYISNILALLVFFTSFCLTIYSKAKDGKNSKVNTELTLFTTIATYARYCFWTGTGFMLIDWLLCSSSAIVPKGVKPGDVFSGTLLSFATIWAIMIFISIVVEVILKIMKKKTDVVYSISSAIPSVIWYPILYFILSFLIG